MKMGNAPAKTTIGEDKGARFVGRQMDASHPPSGAADLDGSADILAFFRCSTSRMRAHGYHPNGARRWNPERGACEVSTPFAHPGIRMSTPQYGTRENIIFSCKG